MPITGIETKAKRCRKCCWGAKYYDFNVCTGKRTPVYFCTFGRGIDGKAPIEPTLDDRCPYFEEPLQDDNEESD